MMEKNKVNNDSKMNRVTKEVADMSVNLEGAQKAIEKEKLELESRRNELKNQEEIWALKLEALKRQEAQIKETIIKEQQKISEEKRSWDSMKEKEQKQLQEDIEARRRAFDEEQKKYYEELDAELKKKRKEYADDVKSKERNLHESVQVAHMEKANELKVKEEEIRLSLQELQTKEAILSRNVQAQNDWNESLRKQEIQFQSEKDAFAKKQQSIDLESLKLKDKERRLQEKEDNIEEVVQERVSEQIIVEQMKLERQKANLINAYERLQAMDKQQAAIEEFKATFGDAPDILKQRIINLEKENKKYEERLHNKIDRNEVEILEKERDRIKEDYHNLRDSYNVMAAKYESYSDLEFEKSQLEKAVKNLEYDKNIAEKRLEDLEDKLKRYVIEKGTESDRESRIATIKVGILGRHEKKEDNVVDNQGMGEKEDTRSISDLDEIKWLDGVYEGCKRYGVEFDKRIFYAFHTALKIQDWSTITVLAGVSGTGKSELPKLYAAFGGFNFCSVAVQPNWDSQESMLGFFNSIDNKFEPEDILRFLVQCTPDLQTQDKSGSNNTINDLNDCEHQTLAEDKNKCSYSDYMSIVLLDEMNLAHVEYYFAEFLSKLESRRSENRDTLPSVSVKLGAGIEPYHLDLPRNILWTGTMNQDETTKSLSDKVLDRGIVINFPRPTKLVRREELITLPKLIRNMVRPKMYFKTFLGWVIRDLSTLTEWQRKELESYKTIVESINDQLDGVGKALGHRVWQSIEFYIVNYPTVRALQGSSESYMIELKKEMKIAFEDQVVQKIMPKLRGIDTRDKKGRHSLDNIERILIENGFKSLQEDFQSAREQGYGQFMWNSAKYLSYKDEDISESADI